MPVIAWLFFLICIQKLIEFVSAPALNMTLPEFWENISRTSASGSERGELISSNEAKRKHLLNLFPLFLCWDVGQRCKALGERACESSPLYSVLSYASSCFQAKQQYPSVTIFSSAFWLTIRASSCWGWWRGCVFTQSGRNSQVNLPAKWLGHENARSEAANGVINFELTVLLLRTKWHHVGPSTDFIAVRVSCLWTWFASDRMKRRLLFVQRLKQPTFLKNPLNPV